jgi:MEDS: MEthanogen/methylotroph, DcmR Sensory domain
VVVRTAVPQKKSGASFVRPPDWSSIGACGHAVQFYPSDGHLLDLLSRFVGTALITGDVAIVIATREHRDGLAARLKARGFDVNVARRQGRYIALDAAGTLDKISRAGRPDDALFREVIGGLVGKLHARGERSKIAAFGEMVALLWAAGKPDAAIQLEQMWNALAAEFEFCLCCAYPMRGFGNGHAASFMKICAQHSHVFTVAQTPDLASAR